MLKASVNRCDTSGSVKYESVKEETEQVKGSEAVEQGRNGTGMPMTVYSINISVCCQSALEQETEFPAYSLGSPVL